MLDTVPCEFMSDGVIGNGIPTIEENPRSYHQAIVSHQPLITYLWPLTIFLSLVIFKDSLISIFYTCNYEIKTPGMMTKSGLNFFTSFYF